MLAIGTVPDLLRLLAVPVFGWTAVRDVKTRRVPNRTWYPLVGLAVVALAWEVVTVVTGATITPVDPLLYGVRVLISFVVVIPLAYGFWWLGGFGGADAKALITLAVLFPTFPTYFLPTHALPVVTPTLGVFSLSVLSNTVVVGILFPFALAVRNLLRGELAKAMFIGRPIRWDQATGEYGRLLQTPDGFSRQGLDLDALRMYLNWRGTTLAELREDPASYRDPASLPADPNPPGDGTVQATDGGEPAAGTADTGSDTGSRPDTPDDPAVGRDDTDAGRDDEPTYDDPWGAARFLNSIEGTAYGTSAEELRGGLDVLASEEEVWITPGIPFLLPMFVGLLVGLTYGDLLYAGLGALGFA